MAPDFATRVDDGFGEARRFFRLVEPRRIGLGVNKLERVNRYHFRVQFFKLALVEKHVESLSRANAKVIAAVLANLVRLLKFARVEVRFTSVAFDEDVLRLHHSLLRANGLNSFTLLAKPGHYG
jgi:hypothetical protein